MLISEELGLSIKFFFLVPGVEEGIGVIADGSFVQAVISIFDDAVDVLCSTVQGFLDFFKTGGNAGDVAQERKYICRTQ